MPFEELAQELARTRGLKFRATSTGFALEICRQHSKFTQCLVVTVGEPCEVHRVTRQTVMENIHHRQPMLDARGPAPVPKVPERSELVGRYSAADLEAGLLRELVARELPSAE